MELFSYNAADAEGCKEVARLEGNAVIVAESGQAFLLKESGVIWKLNDAEAADPIKCLADAAKYNL